MDNKSDDQLLTIQANIYNNSQDSDEKTKKLTAYTTAMIASMMDEIKFYKSSPDIKDSPKLHDPTTMVLDKNKAPPLEGGHSTKNGGIWTLKHDIILPKSYELLIKTLIIGKNSLDLKKFYNYIKICLNVVNRLREDLLPDYQSTNRHSDFE